MTYNTQSYLLPNGLQSPSVQSFIPCTVGLKRDWIQAVSQAECASGEWCEVEDIFPTW